MLQWLGFGLILSLSLSKTALAEDSNGQARRDWGSRGARRRLQRRPTGDEEDKSVVIYICICYMYF